MEYDGKADRCGRKQTLLENARPPKTSDANNAMLWVSGEYPPLEISGNIGATGMEWKLLTPDFRYRHPFITHSRDLERGGPVCTTPHCRLTRDFPPISPDCRISTAFVRRARFRSRC